MNKTVRTILIVLFAGLFLYFGGHIVSVKLRYRESRLLYEGAANTYTAEAHSKPYENGGASTLELVAPITVDFDKLCEINDDVFAWIYCEDSVINYPVVYGRDNDFYLERNLYKRSDPNGTIFSDASNTKGVVDNNLILYGHHMQDMTMFATLKYWLEQDYYESHPVMWLLTPTQDYRIELFSCHTCSATDETYTIFLGPCRELDEYLARVRAQSAFESDVTLESDAKYIMLSTCAYSFLNARTVLHGKLVPVNSAGGVPFDEMDSTT